MNPLCEGDVVLRDGVETVSVKRLRECLDAIELVLDASTGCELCRVNESTVLKRWFGGVQQK